MFVLLFGLMGVAAIFPVGNHYVVEGEKFDLGAALAQNAFEELKGRGMLRPEFWHYVDYADPSASIYGFTVTNGNNQLTGEYETSVIQPDLTNNQPNPGRGTFNITGAPGPGHAFVLDPLGGSADTSLQHVDVFPRYTDKDGDVLNRNTPGLWLVPPNSNPPVPQLTGRRWPVRRITLLDGIGLMQTSVGETIFRLRDDLAVEQPDKSDVPSIQRWDTVDTVGTLDDQSDDDLLRRQYKGDYSWLATIVPTTNEARLALQPASEDYGQIACDVSVVVFRKREFTPSGESERLLSGELFQGGELVLYSELPDDNDAKDEVDNAIDDIRPGNWIMVMGHNKTTGALLLKWYRLLAIDDETSDDQILNNPSITNPVVGRRAMLAGPDWPSDSIIDLRVGLFPGAISVVTKPLRMESSSLWDVE